jgi:hypothetical protein
VPAVTENRLKGNCGAALVMSRLSGECLARPVAAETDVGVDLYGIQRNGTLVFLFRAPPVPIIEQ